jgi:V8-like Glu-specific endopeptidase
MADDENVPTEGIFEDAPAGDPQVSVTAAVLPTWDLSETFFESSTAPRRDPVSSPYSYPWDGVALLNFFRHGGFQGHATAFFVAPDLLITAAHNLTRTRPDAVGVYPAYDAQLNPTGNLGGRAWAVDEGRDVAVIVTHQPWSASLGIGTAAPAAVTLAGYAYAYDGGAPRMTFATGPAAKAGHELRYPLLVDEGDSGAPVFVHDEGAATAMAVHFDRRVEAGESFGVGQFADEDLRQILQQLEQSARAQH